VSGDVRDRGAVVLGDLHFWSLKDGIVTHARLFLILGVALAFFAGGLTASAATGNPCDAVFTENTIAKLKVYDDCRFDQIDKKLLSMTPVSPSPTPSVTPTASPKPSSSPSPKPTTVSPTPTPKPTSSVPPTTAGYWRSDMQSSTALTPATGSPAAGAEWSGWGQGDTNTYGVPHVVSAAAEGLPTPPSGDRVVKLRHSGAQSPFGADQASGPHNMHKLYKQFTVKTWPGGAEPTNRNDGTPDDVSGRYITNLYLPSNQMNFVKGYWSNIMQFKEDYTGTDGSFNSNPSWWVGFNAFDPAHPVLNLSSSGGAHVGPSIPLNTLTDRWVQFELRLYQHDRLELYIDGKLVDTGYDSERRIGRTDYVGQKGTSGNTVAATLGWTFGVGNYTNGNDYPAGASGMYVDLSCVLPLP
jgi:hypothetical protein